MNILINASNLKLGGGLQVADSICNQLYRYSNHRFVVVLSTYLDSTAKRIENTSNIKIIRYDIKNSLNTILFGRDPFLDNLVEREHADCVLTVFGPSRWNPKIPHLSGFAMPHLVLTDSPYFKKLHGLAKIRTNLRFKIVDWAFKRSTKDFFTENEYISRLLQKKWPKHHISTITNYYNQIFDQPLKWGNIDLLKFEGTTLLTVSANYPHKNLIISFDIARILKVRHPEFGFRFVFTVSESELQVPEDIKDHFLLIGKVDISQCPSLYQQSDIVFQPTLLECFTATYPEAMRMKIPILTTDLEFAHGLCGDSAIYYSPLDPSDAADKIYRLATDTNLRKKLVESGNRQLLKFDTSDQRAEKLIRLCETLVKQS